MSLKREQLMLEAKEMMEVIFNRLSSLECLTLDSLEPEKTMLIIVDMNKGFAKGGILYSPRIEGIIKPIEKLANKSIEKGIKTIGFTDFHTEDSIELEAYPKHCMCDTDEWEIVDELNLKEIDIIKKNSTNGFIESNFRIEDNIENLIVVGDCTDICIYQFVLSAKANYNRINKKLDIYVPMNLVETFDLPTHKANFMNDVFLNSMIDNGIKVVKEIVI